MPNSKARIKFLEKFYHISRYYKKLERQICRSEIFQDGEVDDKEFADAVKKNCMNKPYSEMPASFKAFIDQYFRSIDVDGIYSLKLKYLKLVKEIMSICH